MENNNSYDLWKSLCSGALGTFWSKQSKQVFLFVCFRTFWCLRIESNKWDTESCRCLRLLSILFHPKFPNVVISFLHFYFGTWFNWIISVTMTYFMCTVSYMLGSCIRFILFYLERHGVYLERLLNFLFTY